MLISCDKFAKIANLFSFRAQPNLIDLKQKSKNTFTNGNVVPAAQQFNLKMT